MSERRASGTMAKNELRKLHLGLFVYGDKYLDICASIVLPNLLSLIAEIPPDIRAETRLRILTDVGGRVLLSAAPVLARIRALIAVDISDMMEKAGFERYGSYGPMILGQAKLVHEASLENAGLIFCPPDLIWSQGSFAAIVKLAREGYRAVIGPSARGIQEELIPIFQQRIAERGDGTLTISSADLTGLTFDHWQQMNDGFIWNDGPSNSWKSYAYWRLGERQYLMKCWQGPALFLWPHREVKDYDGWIDHRLIKACAHSQAEIYVVPDATLIQTLDLAPRDRGEGHKQVTAKGWYLFRQLLNRKRHCRYNLLYGLEAIRIYDRPLPESAWREAERQFDAETRIPVYSAIAVRPVLALIDGAYRRSGLAYVVRRAREAARSIPVARTMARLAHAGELRPDRLARRLVGRFGIRTRLRQSGLMPGQIVWRIRGVLQIRTRTKRALCALRQAVAVHWERLHPRTRLRRLAVFLSGVIRTSGRN